MWQRAWVFPHSLMPMTWCDYRLRINSVLLLMLLKCITTSKTMSQVGCSVILAQVYVSCVISAEVRAAMDLITSLILNYNLLPWATTLSLFRHRNSIFHSNSNYRQAMLVWIAALRVLAKRLFSILDASPFIRSNHQQVYISVVGLHVTAFPPGTISYLIKWFSR